MAMSNHNLKYSIFLLYLLEEASCLNIVIHILIFSEISCFVFVHKFQGVLSTQSAWATLCARPTIMHRKSLWFVYLELENEQISYITNIHLHAKLFCGINILVLRYLFTLKSWPRSGNKLFPWHYIRIKMSLKWDILILKRIWHQDAVRTKACKRTQRVHNPLDKITLL